MLRKQPFSYQVHDRWGHNRYEQRCVRCGEMVPTGTGRLAVLFMYSAESQDQPSLCVVQHEMCRIRYKNTLVHWEWSPDKHTKKWLVDRIRELRRLGVPPAEARATALFERMTQSRLEPAE